MSGSDFAGEFRRGGASKFTVRKITFARPDAEIDPRAGRRQQQSILAEQIRILE
jgi:hypothetical protein